MKDLKKHGFAQGIYEVSVTRKETIGTYRTGLDGRGYRYAKAGAEALVAGKMSVAAKADSNHIDQAILAAVAVGAKQIPLTVTAGTAIAENQLAGGMFQINSGTGKGHQYLIDGNTAIGVGDTLIYVSLEEAIRLALDTTTTFNLIHNPWYGTDETATDENFATGIAPMVVPAGYYYWAQTHGLAICLIKGTPAVGSNLILGSDEGSVAVIATSVDVDVPIVGKMLALAGVEGDYSAIFLQID